MHILLLSAYDTASHRSWCQGLTQHLSHHQWQYLTLPGRYFSWRIRGNPLSWALGEQADVLRQPYDLIVATSMVDVATLKGLVPSLAQTPTLLYFHENQFAYPSSTEQFNSLEPQMVNLYSALAADQVVFNSHYNRTSFCQGVDALLKKMPDHSPREAVQTKLQNSCVLPVPIRQPMAQCKDKSESQSDTAARPLKLVWNHRWEYDKAPQTLAKVCHLLDAAELPVEVYILGHRFRRWPAAFEQLQDNRPRCVTHMGTLADRQAYEDCLSHADVVLSTAIHEFQGLAVLEATALGCVPLVPDRLAYPEWVPDHLRYPSNPQHPDVEAERIVQTLKHWIESGLPDAPDTTPYAWNQLSTVYDKLLSDVTAKPVISV